MCKMHFYILINTAFIYDFKKDLKTDLVIDMKL